MIEENTFMTPMIWFTGVIESFDDPEELGRVRVRCFGYHTADTDPEKGIPTEDLPLATCIAPVTSASMSGIGEGTTGLLPGSWVVGFFRDGKAAQDPVILGSIPSISFQRGLTYGDGFVDPNAEHPRENGVPDLSRMARSNFAESQFFVKKKELRQEQIETASAPDMSMISGETDLERGAWDNRDPEVDVVPVYPFNHVKEYKCGHIVEYDDTTEKERISEMHKSGTFREINARGDRSVTVVGNEFKVVFENQNVYVKGNCNITVDGNLKTLVKGNYNLEVEGDYTCNIKGNHHEKIGLNYLTDVGQDKFCNVTENRTLRVGQDELREIFIDTETIVKGNSDEIVKGYRAAKIGKTQSVISREASTYSSSNSTMTITSKGQMRLDTKATLNETASSTVSVKGSKIFLN